MRRALPRRLVWLVVMGGAAAGAEAGSINNNEQLDPAALALRLTGAVFRALAADEAPRGNEFEIPAKHDWLEGFDWDDQLKGKGEKLKKLESDLNRELMECQSMATDAEMMIEAAKQAL